MKKIIFFIIMTLVIILCIPLFYFLFIKSLTVTPKQPFDFNIPAHFAPSSGQTNFTIQLPTNKSLELSNLTENESIRAVTEKVNRLGEIGEKINIKFIRFDFVLEDNIDKFEFQIEQELYSFPVFLYCKKGSITKTTEYRNNKIKFDSIVVDGLSLSNFECGFIIKNTSKKTISLPNNLDGKFSGNFQYKIEPDWQSKVFIFTLLSAAWIGFCGLFLSTIKQAATLIEAISNLTTKK